MKTKAITIAHLLVITMLVTSCGEGKQESFMGEGQVQQPINPNGDSELAILMRAMYDEALEMKTQLENGEPIAINLDHEKILTAQATEPEKAASAEYKAFATSYLQSIKALQSANADALEDTYNGMVVNCMMCHTALCPGPMVKIKKLQ